MKKVVITLAIIFLSMAFVGSADAFYAYGSPTWSELEVAAERADIEISRTRPISLSDYAEILEEYVDILKERLENMGITPVSFIIRVKN